MDHIHTIFASDRDVSRGLDDLGPSWPPPKSADPSVFDQFLWETLKAKTYREIFSSLPEQQQNISDEKLQPFQRFCFDLLSAIC
ncbi:hypothetical protein RB195_020300 [Necator americanus]|uniref:Uncharacterized protein n=1 Tax=Necator americanus TaxID=51031 RepID=A0ABR1CI54_NECAM